MLQFIDVNGDKGETESFTLHFLGDEGHLEVQLLSAEGTLVRAQKLESATIDAALAEIKAGMVASVVEHAVAVLAPK